MEQQSLTHQDRCDRCGAQAYARTMHEEGRMLLWCAHHFNQHKDEVDRVTGTKLILSLVYYDNSLQAQVEQRKVKADS